MAVPSALFVKLFMSEDKRDKWMASPIKFIDDYDDWRAMNSVIASSYDGWREELPRGEFLSVVEFLDGIADYSRRFACEYDDDEGALFIADAEHGSGMGGIVASIAALRGASEFVDSGKPSFAYVFPAVSGGDPEALLRIESGKSYFLSPGDSSPDTLYFVNEAEDFIETLLEGDK